MKYKIKPLLIPEKQVYNVLFDEIMSLSLNELDIIIMGIECVFDGKHQANSFSGQHMSSIDYDKNVAKIMHFEELIGEEPTIEIYNMLKAYRVKVKEYEN
jgi:hypothetical protein